MSNLATLRQHIIFDLDDTLVYCNKYFDLVLEQFGIELEKLFGQERLTAAEIRTKQVEIDVAGVQQLGFATQHFPASLVETYRYFSGLLGVETNQLEEARLTKLGLSVYDMEIEPYPGMIETLDVLKAQGHGLYLYTGGEAKVQQRKIDQMKLTAYFDDRVYIRQHKNYEALKEIIEMHDFDRTRTWMIGNSLRTDIEPALTAGLNSIYIKHPDEWLYNIIDMQKHTDTSLYTVSSLKEVPGIVSERVAIKHKQSL